MSEVEIATPSHPIPGLAEMKTLEMLAAEGKYASVAFHMPVDVMSGKWRVTLDGVDVTETHMVREVYAPGDDTGWAVVYGRDGDAALRTELIRGNWGISRDGT